MSKIRLRKPPVRPRRPPDLFVPSSPSSPIKVDFALQALDLMVLQEKKIPKPTFTVDKHVAFKELNIEDLEYESIGRVRQHVNPLSIDYQIQSDPLPWDDIFEDPKRPLIVDAGSGYGRFPLLAAKNDVEPINYLGTEIRRALLSRANSWAKKLELSDRVHFTFCNITISLQSLLVGYPGDVIGIYIQFPDPAFKKRKIKRHIVQPGFVKDCGAVLVSGGRVFMQSDVESCAVYSRSMFDIHGSDLFDPDPLHSKQDNTEPFMGQTLTWGQLSWPEKNPIGYPTEREVYSQEQGLFIYRTLLIKK